MRLSREERQALAFIAGMILLSVLGRWADRPRPLTTDLVAINIDSLEKASAAAVPRKGKARNAPSTQVAASSSPVARSTAVARTPPAAREPAAPVNLNTATAEELEKIPGIGTVLASRIIEYRQTRGRFANVEALVGVKGVGPAMLERLRPHVRAP